MSLERQIPEWYPLSKKERRKRRAQQARQEKHRLSRRQAIRKGIILFAGLSATTGGGIAVWQVASVGHGRREQSGIAAMSEETKGLHEDYQRNEGKLAQVLERTDLAMQWLSESLVPRLLAYSDDDRARLLAPIDIYKVNQANPNRNKYIFLRSDLERRGNKALKLAVQIPLQDLRHFYFQLLEEESFAGGFSPPDRTVYINEQFTPSNLFDVLVLYHELEHVRHDTEFRRRLTTQQAFDNYLRFYTIRGGGKRPRIIGAWEQEAYLKEILVMNAILDGRVRRDVINNSFDVNDYLRQLNASASNTKSVEFLFRISKSIYESGSTLTNFAPAYADMINVHYRRDRGFDIYQLNQSGILEYLP